MGTKQQVFNRKEKKMAQAEYDRPANQLQKKKHPSKTLEKKQKTPLQDPTVPRLFPRLLAFSLSNFLY